MNDKVKVLIADDEVLIRIGIIHAIDWAKNGFEIVGEATDGESCLRLTERLQPDLIVLDINMPGMNGIQVLQKLKERNFQGKVIMLTCYDEFEYVREAMRGGASDYVLKAGMNENGLLDAVKRLDYGGKKEKYFADSQDLKTEQLLRRRLEGCSIGGEEQFRFRENGFCCVAGKIRNMSDVEKRYEQRGMDLFYRSLLSILEQTLQGYDEYDVLLYDRSTVTIFVSFSKTPSMQEKLLKIRRLTGHLLAALQNYLDLSLELGVSGFCYGKDEIRKAWEQAQMVLDRAFIEKGSLFYFTDFQDEYNRQSEICRQLREMEIQLKKTVLDDQAEQIREGLQAYFEQIRKSRIISAGRIRGFCLDIMKLLQARKKDWKNQDILEHFAEQESLEEVESCIYAWLDQILPPIVDQNANWQVRRACDYIREYYQKDLNLTEIARYLQLSESYTSRIFNREMGMNIPAYINQVRLERARELLRYSNKKIYEIAMEVGYLSTTAFHVAFKKQTGITPAEYRNQAGESSVQI